MYSPLEAFKTDSYFYHVSHLLPLVESIVITSSTITIVMGIILLLLLLNIFSYSVNNTAVEINRNNNEFTAFIFFKISGFYKDSLPYQLRDFFISFITLGLFISVFNLLGLFPYNAAITSQLIPNLTFTFSLILGLLGLGFAAKGEQGFLHHFIPGDVPIFIVPFIFIIEVISFFIRIFSMSIRLFANTVAGHSLLHMLQGLYSFLLSNIKLILLSFIPVAILYFWLVFEFFVALLQTYVFVLLFLIYLADLA